MGFSVCAAVLLCCNQLRSVEKQEPLP